jgi:hypothetical protein
MSAHCQRARGVRPRLPGMSSETFKIVPMPADVVRALRETRVDAVGNILTVRKDGGRHQCRSCLRLTEPREGYLAVSYAPMAGSQPFAERGPVYIHQRECEPYADISRYPEELPRHAVVLRAYGETEEIEDARFVGDATPEEVIRDLFTNPAITFLHARNATYGCYMFKLERAAAV